MITRRLKYIPLFLLSTVLVSCAINKRIINKNERYEGLTEKKFYRLLDSQTDDKLSTLEVSKFVADYYGTEEQKKLRGFVRLKHDSIIMVSVAPLMGIEIFRLKAERDSVGVIDRYHKTYTSGDYGLLNRMSGFPLDYQVLQSVLTGQLYPLEERGYTARQFREKDEFYMIEYLSGSGINRLGIVYYFSKELQIKRVLFTNYSGGATLTVDYPEFFNDGCCVGFPRRIIFALVEKHSMSKLEVEFRNVEKNKAMNFPFNISDAYSLIKN